MTSCSVSSPKNENETAEQLKERLKSLVGSSKIMIFIKGTPTQPMCGFSANTVAILNSLGVQYNSFNILEDENVRQGLKELSNWPTYPQIYFQGKLVGGNDIVTEMYHNGDLKKMFI